MSELNVEQVVELKKLLQQREQSVREDIRRELSLKDDYVDIASEFADPGDASFADLSVDLGNAAVTRDLTELRAIQHSYTRIDNGSYGDCIECGYAIPYERLKVQPIAERCAPCQDMYEKTHIDAMKGATM